MEKMQKITWGLDMNGACPIALANGEFFIKLDSRGRWNVKEAATMLRGILGWREEDSLLTHDGTCPMLVALWAGKGGFDEDGNEILVCTFDDDGNSL